MAEKIAIGSIVKLKTTAQGLPVMTVDRHKPGSDVMSCVWWCPEERSYQTIELHRDSVTVLKAVEK